MRAPIRASIDVAPIRRRAGVVLVSLLLVACGGGSDTTAPPPPVGVTVSPSTTTVNAGAVTTFTATVSNTRNAAVTWSASGGTISGSGNTASWTAPQGGGPYTITATSIADPTKSGSATVTVNPVAVAITPTAGAVGAGGTQTFSATVSNTSNTAVTWTASGGTITGSGASISWTAPAAGGSYTVTATSVADPTKTASAAVTVTPVQITVTPSTALLWRGEPLTVTASVTGTAQTGVTWSASCGSIAGNGLSVTFTAPTTAGPCTVSARSQLDDTKMAVATVTTRAPWRVASLDDTDDGACTWSHCSLREALAAANAQANVDTVRLLTTTPGTIMLTSALPVVETPVHLIGPGAALLTLNANGSDANRRRGLEFRGDITASVSGLTVRGGVAAGGAGIAVGTNASVAMSDLRLVANEARGGTGGGLRFTSGGRGQLRNVVIDSNRTIGETQPGGGLSLAEGSVVTMTGGAVRANRVANGWGGGVRVLESTLTLDSVEVSGNVVEGGAGTGGGILAEGASGSLTLRGTTVRGNQSPVNAGGISLTNSLATASITGSTITENISRFGGGLLAFNVSALTITNSSVRANRATTRGGGLALTGTTTATIGGSTIRRNIADSTGGGGLYTQNRAVVRLTETSVDSNQANGPANSTQGGGGAWVGTDTRFEMTGGTLSSNSTEAGWGGGVWSSGATVGLTNVAASANRAGGAGGAMALNSASTATITGGVVRDNQAVIGAGGGVMVSDATASITGTQFSGNSAALQGGALQIRTSQAPGATATATLTNVTVTGNRAEGDGGGIGAFGAVALTMTGGVVSENRSVTATGGGLSRNSTQPLTITGTRFLTNQAQTQGGGLQIVGSGASTVRAITVSGNRAVTGGGGLTIGGAAMLLEQSTLAENTSTGGPGGGIFSSSTAVSTIRNVTLSRNSAAIGGGIGVTGSATLQHLTVIGNQASDFGGGIGSNNASGNVTVTNTLLAGNTRAAAAQNCATGNGGALTSVGGNLSDDPSCATFTQPTDLRNTPAGVEPTLADNGGPTLTHALRSGSAAINAAVAGACPTVDQRGFGRQGACDIGAFEFNGTAPAAGARLQAPITRPAPVRVRPPSAKESRRSASTRGTREKPH